MRHASQGGSIALAAAGLVPDLLAAPADMAFLFHFPRAVNLSDRESCTEIPNCLSVERDEVAAAFPALSYLDGVTLARRAPAPAKFSVGLMDPFFYRHRPQIPSQHTPDNAMAPP